MGLKGGEHLGRGVGGQQQRLKVRLDKIAALGAQGIEVGLEQYLDGPQVDQIPGLHHLHQAALVDDPVKDLLEGLAIAPRGGRGHAHHQRPVRLPGTTMGEDPTVRGRGGMVRFVNDDGAKIGDQAGEPSAATQGLDTGHHDRGGQVIPRRLHDAQGERRINEVQFVEGLLDQLVTVRQDQGAAAPPLHEQRKDDRFARAGGQDQQGAVHPARGRGQQGSHGFMLVRPRGQTQQRGSSNSRHRGGPRRPGRGAAAHRRQRPPRVIVRSIPQTTRDCNRRAHQTCPGRGVPRSHGTPMPPHRAAAPGRGEYRAGTGTPRHNCPGERPGRRRVGGSGTPCRD